MIFVRGKLQSNPVVLCYFSAELQLWDRINFELPSPPVSCPPYPSSSSDNDAEMATPSSLQKQTQSQQENSTTQHTTAASSTLLPISRNTNHSVQFASTKRTIEQVFELFFPSPCQGKKRERQDDK